MITCDNCGAQYDDEENQCPYCGCDNFGKIVQEHEDIINGLKREKEKMQNMPQKAAKTGKSLTRKILIGLVILVTISALYTLISGIIERKISYQIKTRRIEKLEAMYQQGDYQGIYQYIKKKSLFYDSAYDKYSDIAEMERYFENSIHTESDDYQKWIIENDKWDGLFDVGYVVDVLKICWEKEDNFYKYNEEDCVIYYRDRCYRYLEDNYGINREEAEGAIEDAGGFDDEYITKNEITEQMQKLAINKLKEEER